jgi:maleate isomerase
MQTKQENTREFINLTHLPFVVDEGVAARARIGLIVLASDHTVEHEFRQVANIPGVAIYQSRIPNSPTITPESLRAMEPHITERTDVILPGVPLDVVAYGCTSASMIIGEKRVFELIHAARPEAKATTPITAAFAAFRATGCQRIGVLTPYSDEVNQFIRRYIESSGFEVPVFGSFNQDNDNTVARISADSMRDAVLEIGKHDNVDGVFVSCTSLRLAHCVTDIEKTLGKPVTSSNHALIWHSLRLAGIDDVINGYGRLFQLPG